MGACFYLRVLEFLRFCKEVLLELQDRGQVIRALHPSHQSSSFFLRLQGFFLPVLSRSPQRGEKRSSTTPFPLLVSPHAHAYKRARTQVLMHTRTRARTRLGRVLLVLDCAFTAMYSKFRQWKGTKRWVHSLFSFFPSSSSLPSCSPPPPPLLLAPTLAPGLF